MAVKITQKYELFKDVDGDPLENGYIYIGTTGLNPETSPITVYFDEALTLPASQPLRTSGGYIQNAGTPANIYVDTDYSIIVRNKNETLIYASLSNNAEAGLSSSVDTIGDLIGLDEATTTEELEVYGYHAKGDGAGGLFIWDSTASKPNANGGTIIDPSVSLANQGTGVGTGCWIRQYSGAINIKWFGAKGDTVLTGRNVFVSGTDNTDIINNIIDDLGSPLEAISIFIPKGIYLISGSITNKSSSSALNLVSFVGEEGSGIDFITSATSKKYPSTLYKNTAGNMFSWNINPDGSAVEAHGRPITLKHLSLASDEASTGVYAINGYWMGSSLIQNINIAFFDYGIKMDGSTDHLTDDYVDGLTLNNINIVGIKKEGIRIRGADYSNISRIFMGEFEDTAYLGLGLISAFGTQVDNLLINDMDYQGGSTIPTILDVASTVTISYCKALKFNGAHFERNVNSIFNIRFSTTISASNIYSFRTYSSLFRINECSKCELQYGDMKEYAPLPFTGNDYAIYGSSAVSFDLLFFQNRIVDTSDVDQTPVVYVPDGGTYKIKTTADVIPELCKIAYDGTGDGSAGSGVIVTDQGTGGLSIDASDVTVTSVGEVQIRGAYNGKPYGVSLMNSGGSPVSYIPKLNNTGFLSIYMIAISDGSTLTNKTTAFNFSLSFALLK